MRITEDMKADRDWLVQTHNRTAAGGADSTVAWNDLSEAGWSDVFARISGTWRLFDDQRRPTNRMPFMDRHALLQTCGVFKAGLVLASLDLWVASPDGARPPAAADLYALIAQPQSKGGGDANLAPPLRRDQRPEALAFVAGLIHDGRKVCECCPAPMTLVRDDHDTLWCPDCGGIEMGQADAATAGPDEPAADVPLHELGAVFRLRRVREAA